MALDDAGATPPETPEPLPGPAAAEPRGEDEPGLGGSGPAERPTFQHRSERHGLVGPFSGRQLAALLGIVAVAAVVLVAATRSLGTVGSAGPGDPRPTAYLLSSPTTGLEPGSLAPELAGTRADGTAWALTDVDGRPVRLADLRGQGRLAQLLGELVSPVPGRDAGPARHLRRLPRPRARAHRDQRPGVEPGRRRRVRREVRARLHDRGGPVGRCVEAVPRATACRPTCSSIPRAGSGR